MKYKTELHCHSRDVSACSNESVEGIVEKYLAAGYTTVCLTNHFAPSGDDEAHWVEKVEKLYYGYDKLVKAASGWLNIVMGMELRFHQNSNDYLVFGFDKQYLLDRPGILKMGIGKYIGEARKNGLFTIQAHPCRYGMTTTQPDRLYAMDVFNGHPGHNSNNDIALHWADKYGLIKTSGTDHHDRHHVPDGGIITDSPIHNAGELIAVLKSGNYELIRGF